MNIKTNHLQSDKLKGVLIKQSRLVLKNKNYHITEYLSGMNGGG